MNKWNLINKRKPFDLQLILTFWKAFIINCFYRYVEEPEVRIKDQQQKIILTYLIPEELYYNFHMIFHRP